MVSKGNCPRYAAVRERLQDFKSAWDIGPAKKDVSGMDYQVRLYPFQGIPDTAERPFAPGISGYIMGIGELQKSKLAFRTISELPGNGKVAVFRRGRGTRLKQRTCCGPRRHKCGTFEERPAFHSFPVNTSFPGSS
jgi:hypothetical protein